MLNQHVDNSPRKRRALWTLCVVSLMRADTATFQSPRSMLLEDKPEFFGRCGRGDHTLETISQKPRNRTCRNAGRTLLPNFRGAVCVGQHPVALMKWLSGMGDLRLCMGPRVCQFQLLPVEAKMIIIVSVRTATPFLPARSCGLAVNAD